MAWPMLTRYDRCVLESMLRCDTVSPTPGSVVYCLAASQSILLADEDLYRTRSVIRLPNGDQALGTSIEHTHTRHLSATIPSLPSARSLARTHDVPFSQARRTLRSWASSLSLPPTVSTCRILRSSTQRSPARSLLLLPNILTHSFVGSPTNRKFELAPQSTAGRFWSIAVSPSRIVAVGDSGGNSAAFSSADGTRWV